MLINYLIPQIFGVIPLFTNDYINVGAWCWIGNNNIRQKVYRWIFFYGQLTIIFIYICYVYIRIYIYLYFNEKGKQLKDKVNKLFHRIKWYPLCLILSFTIATFKRFYELFDELGFGWHVAQTITTGLYGLFLFIVYGNVGKIFKLCCPQCYTKIKTNKNNNNDQSNVTNDTTNDTTNNTNDFNRNQIEMVITNNDNKTNINN